MAALILNEMRVDDELPELILPAISRATLALYAGASGDHNPIHIDSDAAKQAGFTDVFAHGMLVMAYLGRAITDVVPQSVLREFGVSFISITQVHDVLHCSGCVVDCVSNKVEQRYHFTLTAVDSKDDIKLRGTAVIAQPHKENNVCKPEKII